MSLQRRSSRCLPSGQHCGANAIAPSPTLPLARPLGSSFLKMQKGKALQDARDKTSALLCGAVPRRLALGVLFSVLSELPSTETSPQRQAAAFVRIGQVQMVAQLVLRGSRLSRSAPVLQRTGGLGGGGVGGAERPIITSLAVAAETEVMQCHSQSCKSYALPKQKASSPRPGAVRVLWRNSSLCEHLDDLRSKDLWHQCVPCCDAMRRGLCRAILSFHRLARLSQIRPWGCSRTRDGRDLRTGWQHA